MCSQLKHFVHRSVIVFEINRRDEASSYHWIPIFFHSVIKRICIGQIEHFIFHGVCRSGEILTFVLCN
uniref:Ovule protein n=1 Tax=Ascaris lumbricoides TaxID=6252 RepID=A0A0M3I853_ASCLU